jgi:hypothetical protein
VESVSLPYRPKPSNLLPFLSLTRRCRPRRRPHSRPRRRRGGRGWPRRPRRRRGRDLTGDRDGAAGRGVAGGGEVEKLRVGGCGILGWRVRWSPEYGGCHKWGRSWRGRMPRRGRSWWWGKIAWEEDDGPRPTTPLMRASTRETMRQALNRRTRHNLIGYGQFLSASLRTKGTCQLFPERGRNICEIFEKQVIPLIYITFHKYIYIFGIIFRYQIYLYL